MAPGQEACFPFQPSWRCPMTIFQCVVYYAVPLTTIFAFYALMARRLFQSAASLPGEQEGHGPARNRQVGSDQPGLAQGHAQGAQGFRQIYVCLCGEVCRADRALRTTAVHRAGPGLALSGSTDSQHAQV